MNDLTLVVRRRLRAPPERVFAAWTRPEALMQWWGPEGVQCPEAEVELEVGGRLSIANQLPDGSILWLKGVFEAVEPPDRLVYTWVMGDADPERVTVEFRRVDSVQTDLVLRHERIGSQPLLEGHERGWLGCLDGLERLLD